MWVVNLHVYEADHLSQSSFFDLDLSFSLSVSLLVDSLSLVVPSPFLSPAPAALVCVLASAPSEPLSSASSLLLSIYLALSLANNSRSFPAYLSSRRSSLREYLVHPGGVGVRVIGAVKIHPGGGVRVISAVRIHPGGVGVMVIGGVAMHPGCV